MKEFKRQEDLFSLWRETRKTAKFNLDKMTKMASEWNGKENIPMDICEDFHSTRWLLLEGLKISVDEVGGLKRQWKKFIDRNIERCNLDEPISEWHILRMEDFKDSVNTLLREFDERINNIDFRMMEKKGCAEW